MQGIAGVWVAEVKGRDNETLTQSSVCAGPIALLTGMLQRLAECQQYNSGGDTLKHIMSEVQNLRKVYRISRVFDAADDVSHKKSREET